MTKDKIDKLNLKNIFLDKSINFIPILSKNKKLLEIVTLEETFSKDNLHYSKLPVVIMAGGEGKRLLPLTKVLPKPLLRYIREANDRKCDATVCKTRLQ